MQKCNIKSSTSVREAYYSATTQVLRVEFQSGVVYEYSKVPNEVVEQWEACARLPKGSTGSQFHALIKTAGFSFKKV